MEEARDAFIMTMSQGEFDVVNVGEDRVDAGEQRVQAAWVGLDKLAADVETDVNYRCQCSQAPGAKIR